MLPSGIGGFLLFRISSFIPLQVTGRHTTAADLGQGVGPAVVAADTACGLGRECPHCAAVAGEGDGDRSVITLRHREKEDVKGAAEQPITRAVSVICHLQAVAGRDAQAGAAVGEGELIGITGILSPSLHRRDGGIAAGSRDSD